MWNLEDGLALIRAIQPNTRKFGYHLALGGGVLNKGESKKDLDLYFLPLEDRPWPQANSTGLIKWLEGMWGESLPLGRDYSGSELKVSCYTHKLKFMRGNTERIDVFIGGIKNGQGSQAKEAENVQAVQEEVF